MKEYFKNGYCLAKGVIDTNIINSLLVKLRSIFGKITTDTSDIGIMDLYKNDFDKFYGAANICQWLIPLYKLDVSEQIINLIKSLGINSPIMNIRPLISYSSSKLAKNEMYWKVPAHQDWPSTQGSLNGLTVWIPLVPVNEDLGALEVVPKSHLLGLLPSVEIHGAPVLDNENWTFESVPMEVGDALVFSNFLIHRSGVNSTEDKIRWSVHCRYDDADEPTFIERNFPHHRTDKRLPGLLHPDFPSQDQLKNYFNVFVE